MDKYLVEETDVLPDNTKHTFYFYQYIRFMQDIDAKHGISLEEANKLKEKLEKMARGYKVDDGAIAKSVKIRVIKI